VRAVGAVGGRGAGGRGCEGWGREGSWWEVL
jgi:hypothetical protein